MLELELFDDKLVTTLKHVERETNQLSPTSVICPENEYPEYNEYRITEKKESPPKSKNSGAKPEQTRRQKSLKRKAILEKRDRERKKIDKREGIRKGRDLKEFRNFGYLLKAAEAAKPVEIQEGKPEVMAKVKAIFPLEHRKEFPARLPKLDNDKVFLPNGNFVPNPLYGNDNEFVNYNRRNLLIYKMYWYGIVNFLKYFSVTRYLKSQQGFPGYWLEIKKAQNQNFENVIFLSARVLITAIETESFWYIFINNEDKYFRSFREEIYKIISALKNTNVYEITNSPGLYGRRSEALRKLQKAHLKKEEFKDIEQKDYDCCALTCNLFKGRCGVCNPPMLEKKVEKKNLG
tara:strand:- start:233 stop:1276 length:1044 start_codon:yes stop_codon:yes gene_type:complete